MSNKPISVRPNIIDPSMMTPENDLPDCFQNISKIAKPVIKKEATSEDSNVIVFVALALIIIALIIVIIWFLLKNNQNKESEEELKRRILPDIKSGMPPLPTKPANAEFHNEQYRLILQQQAEAHQAQARQAQQAQQQARQQVQQQMPANQTGESQSQQEQVQPTENQSVESQMDKLCPKQQYSPDDILTKIDELREKENSPKEEQSNKNDGGFLMDDDVLYSKIMDN